MEYQKKVIIQVFDYLAHLPQKDPYINGPDLLEAIRAEGDNTLQPSRINDAVNYLREKNAVDIASTYGTKPYDFARVKISSTGINIRIRGEDIFKSISDSGDIYIMLNIGDNFSEIKDKIRKHDSYSETEKNKIIEQVEILEIEEKNETPDIRRAQRAYNWIKEKLPPFVIAIIENLIANLITQGLVK